MSKEKLRELVYQSDVTTLLQDGLQKLLNGDSTVEEILKLIELEEDETLNSDMDLKKALELVEITNESLKNNSTPKTNIDIKPSVEQKIEEPKVTEEQPTVNLETVVPNKIEKPEIKEQPKKENDKDDPLKNLDQSQMMGLNDLLKKLNENKD